MNNKKKLPAPKGKIVEKASVAKTKKPDVPDPKNVATASKDSKTVADPKKPATEQKEKKTVTIITDPQEKKSVAEPKEKKTVTISDPKDKAKDKRMVTFVTDLKDKRIVTDTRENKIMSIETKEKVVVPVVPEVKEKKIAPPVEPKESPKVVVPVVPAVPVVPVVAPVVPVAAPVVPVVPVVPVMPVAPVVPIVPAVPEVKEKIPVPRVKEKKEVPPVPELKKHKALHVVPETKKKKAVPEAKEKAPPVEVKEKKVVPEVKEKRLVVVEKVDDETSELARTIAESVVAAAVEFVEEARNPIKNIKWISHGEFTVEKGRKQIEEFISVSLNPSKKTSGFQNRWVYYADFIEKRDLVHSFHYIYRVCWSAPTAVRPLARVSAFAYFTIKFNKSKPPDMPVEVSYVFENSGLIQRPGSIRFREQWLRDITETKQILLESIPFKVV